MRIALRVAGVLMVVGAGSADRATGLATADEPPPAPTAAARKPPPEAKVAVGQAAPADVIAPGIDVDAARAMLKRHGVDQKYGLALRQRDENTTSDTWRIDDNVVVVLDYDKRTQKVTSLSAYFIPDYRPTKGGDVVREVLEISFEKDGVYSIKLKRRPSKGAK
jgi:hypothetical protein